MAAAGRRSPETSFPADRLHPIAAETPRPTTRLPNSGGTGAGNLTNNYLREEAAHDRSRQLRRQDQLQPHADAPDLGQVQHARRGRGRSDVLPRPRSELGPGRRVHQGLHGHRRPDVDARPDARVGHDRRLLAAGPESLWRGLLPGQHRARHAGHPRHQRSGHRQRAVCWLSRSSPPASARSATTTPGRPSGATSG